MSDRPTFLGKCLVWWREHLRAVERVYIVVVLTILLVWVAVNWLGHGTPW